MADRKLVKMWPKARVPNIVAKDYGREYLERIGKIKTFFNLPCYDNPIGIEIESEGFDGLEKDLLLWRVTEDNSLRGEGVEFISVPLVRTTIDYALYEIAKPISKLSFGHRTSIHVHCNVAHYTAHQLAVLTAYYAMLEKLFFSLTQGREGNTFCYPIVGTSPVLEWYEGRDGAVDRTTKYCAFNINPIKTQMSVEFRHCHGTNDIKTIRRWVQICAKLVYYCGNLPPATCIRTALDEIATRRFEGETIRKIWGDTTDIFTPSEIHASVRNGELWAATVLTS
jgi:hypothetical protein